MQQNERTRKSWTRRVWELKTFTSNHGTSTDRIDRSTRYKFQKRYELILPEESEISSQADVNISELTEEHIGERVVVEGYNSIGILRFVGLHATNNCLRYGIEFDDAVGRNNGTVKGHKYFEYELKRKNWSYFLWLGYNELL